MSQYDKGFLVALLNQTIDLPVYALVNWEGESSDGKSVSCGSNTIAMLHLGRRDHNLFSMRHGQSWKDAAISLTDYGKETAKYLQSELGIVSRFTNIDTGKGEGLYKSYGFPPLS